MTACSLPSESIWTRLSAAARGAKSSATARGYGSSEPNLDRTPPIRRLPLTTTVDRLVEP